MPVQYLDTSAFIKLVRSEQESEALREHIGAGDELISSALLVVEGRRAAARYGRIALDRARRALVAITLIPVDDRILERAAGLEPSKLRSLDALHLAAALELGPREIAAFLCYDERLAVAAKALKFEVRAPS